MINLRIDGRLQIYTGEEHLWNDAYRFVFNNVCGLDYTSRNAGLHLRSQTELVLGCC